QAGVSIAREQAAQGNGAEAQTGLAEELPAGDGAGIPDSGFQVHRLILSSTSRPDSTTHSPPTSTRRPRRRRGSQARARAVRWPAFSHPLRVGGSAPVLFRRVPP